MAGRLAWGPFSDATGCGRTLVLLSANTACLLAMPAASAMLTVPGADPQTALTMFRAAAAGNIFLVAGAPVVLAPAVAELFGRGDATAIYQRIGATITIASPLGATIVTGLRDRAYLHHATELTKICDETAFVAAFGEPSANLPALIKSKTVTLPLLLHIAPAGTPDPTPMLYDSAFHTLAGCSALALVCNVAAFQVLPPPRRNSDTTSSHT